MSESWFLVIRTADGTLESSGTVVADPLPAGLTAVPLSDADAEAWRGGVKQWDAATRAIVPVVPPVPECVFPWQLDTAMLQVLNIKPTDIDAMISSMPEGQEKWQAQIDRSKATLVKRNHPVINQMAVALGKTPAEVDDLFRYAATLQG